MEGMINESLLSWITDANLKIIFSSIIMLGLMTIVASGIDFLLNSLIIKQINNYFNRSNSYFFNLIANRYLLNSISRISIGLVFVFGSFILAKNTDPIAVSIATAVLKLANIYNICILNICLNKCIAIYHDYYEHKLHHNDKPIESYVRVVNFLSWVVTAILIVSYVFNRTPVTILTGIGAVSAFILLIFKDTFLGIVASIQASATSLVKVGDWIIIDKYNIDGEIISISINSVKIQNSDNTTTTVPTYALTTEAVRNMQSMRLSGGRLIQELIHIDTKSVIFLTTNLIKSLTQKYPELSELVSNQISNLTLFRKHILNYLTQHDQLNHKNRPCVNTLAPNHLGIPLEIYTFTNEITYDMHSSVKSEIIEYILMSLNDFELVLAHANLHLAH